MLSNLRIDNFRVFNPLTIERLGKINLFCGQNNAGKTSLLEALFLLSGSANPGLLLNPNVLRGIQISFSSGNTVQDTLWNTLFHGLDMRAPIEISGQHSSLGKLTLQIAVELPAQFELQSDNGKAAFGGGLRKEALALRYMLNGQLKAHFNLFLAGDSVQAQSIQPAEGAPEMPFGAVIISPTNREPQEDAQRLGQLRQHKKADLVVEALQVIEPGLKSIEVNTATGVAMIWGDIGMKQLAPLSVMGDGMIQLARIILAISSTPGGIALIDEVDNGIHHSMLSRMWQVIQQAADQFDVQIFATTHSYGCIETAVEVFGTSPDDAFLLHRIDATKTGTRCVTYDKQTMKTAMQYNMEVR